MMINPMLDGKIYGNPRPNQRTRQSDTGGGQASYYNNYAQQQAKMQADKKRKDHLAQMKLLEDQAAKRRAAEQAARLREKQIADKKRKDYLAQMKLLQDQAAQRSREQYEKQQEYLRSRANANSEYFNKIDNLGYYNKSAEKYQNKQKAPVSMGGFFGDLIKNNPHTSWGYGGGPAAALASYYGSGVSGYMENKTFPRYGGAIAGDPRSRHFNWNDGHTNRLDAVPGQEPRLGTGYGERHFNWNDGKKPEFMWEINPEINYTMPEDGGGGGGWPDYGGWDDWNDWGDGGDWPNYDYPEWDYEEAPKRWFENMLSWKI